MADLATAIERPSGKGAGDENFPVGSRLIVGRLRGHVMAYYRFARGADDIADAPDLTAADKIARLDALDAGFALRATGPRLATELRDSLAATGVGQACARDLLVAFRRDAANPRTADWADLMGYCAVSAHPVGRYLMELHGEPARLTPMGDALCAALQVLNHLQDIRADWTGLGRVYLPADWLAAAGVTDADLAAPRASPGLRAVIDQCLDGTDALLDRAAPLAGAMRNRRLGAETAAIQCLARRLAAQLRRRDPMARRVAHRRRDLGLALGAALLRLAGWR